MTAKTLARIHLALAVFWTLSIPVAVFTGLKNSLPFLVTISLLALVFSELAAWQAARGERRADPDDHYGDGGLDGV